MTNPAQNGERQIKHPSRFLGARIRPEAQQALNDALDAGIVKTQTEAVEKGLERLGRSARRALMAEPTESAEAEE